jgi:hypothetical protein
MWRSQMMDAQAEYPVTTLDRLVNLVIDELSAGRVCPDANDRYARIQERVIDHSLDDRIAFLLGFLPK